MIAQESAAIDETRRRRVHGRSQQVSLLLLIVGLASLGGGCAMHRQPGPHVPPHLNPYTQWLEHRPSLEARIPPPYHAAEFMYGYNQTCWRPWPVEIIEENVSPLGEYGFSNEGDGPLDENGEPLPTPAGPEGAGALPPDSTPGPSGEPQAAPMQQVPMGAPPQGGPEAAPPANAPPMNQPPGNLPTDTTTFTPRPAPRASTISMPQSEYGIREARRPLLFGGYR